jgi:hypothetical protein
MKYPLMPNSNYYDHYLCLSYPRAVEISLATLTVFYDTSALELPIVPIDVNNLYRFKVFVRSSLLTATDFLPTSIIIMNIMDSWSITVAYCN